MLAKTDVKGYIKDTKSGVIYPSDDSLEEFRRAKMKSKELEELKRRMSNVESNINDIKNMLSAIVGKLNE